MSDDITLKNDASLNRIFLKLKHLNYKTHLNQAGNEFGLE